MIDHLKPRARTEADYLWYRNDLTQRDRPLALPSGFVLRQGTLEDLELLLEMPRHAGVTTMTERVVHRRLAADGTPWLVVHDGQLVFCCWTFDRSLPVSGERTNRLELPDGVSGLEDSIVRREFRERGIASAAWSQIADRHAQAGRRAVVVKVDVRNAPSRRVAEKAGFAPVAEMRIVWRDWRTIVRVALPDGDARCRWLRRLERG